MQGAANATIAVTYHGQTASTTAPIANTAPGIFTANFSGSGQAVALNADATLNSSTSPATAGTVITFFGTGEGWTNPTGEDGMINDRLIREPQAPVRITIGGKPAQLIYAGTAFGLVQGVLQVEALIPAGVTGTAPVVLTVGSATSQTTATISVK